MLLQFFIFFPKVEMKNLKIEVCFHIKRNETQIMIFFPLCCGVSIKSTLLSLLGSHLDVRVPRVDRHSWSESSQCGNLISQAGLRRRTTFPDSGCGHLASLQSCLKIRMRSPRHKEKLFVSRGARRSTRPGRRTSGPG